MQNRTQKNNIKKAWSGIISLNNLLNGLSIFFLKTKIGSLLIYNLKKSVLFKFNQAIPVFLSNQLISKQEGKNMTESIFPQPIETEHLLIRVAEPKDAAMLYQAASESIEALKPWLLWAKQGITLEALTEYCQTSYAKYWLNEDVTVFFLLKTNGEFVGSSGLHHANWQLRQFEIGYWGRVRYSQQGLMKEGVQALSSHAMQQLRANRVCLRIDDKNTKSWRLAEHAGFKVEGILRCSQLGVENQLCAMRIYAKTIQDVT